MLLPIGLPTRLAVVARFEEAAESLLGLESLVGLGRGSPVSRCVPEPGAQRLAFSSRQATEPLLVGGVEDDMDPIGHRCAPQMVCTLNLCTRTTRDHAQPPRSSRGSVTTRSMVSGSAC